MNRLESTGKPEPARIIFGCPDNPRPHSRGPAIDRRLLETRVRRLANPSMHAQRPPSRTRHLIGNVTIEEARADGLATACVFQMLEYRLDRQRVFGGFCRHDLVRTDDGFRIRAKRVELVNCDSLLEGIATLL